MSGNYLSIFYPGVLIDRAHGSRSSTFAGIYCKYNVHRIQYIDVNASGSTRGNSISREYSKFFIPLFCVCCARARALVTLPIFPYAASRASLFLPLRVVRRWCNSVRGAKCVSDKSTFRREENASFYVPSAFP